MAQQSHLSHVAQDLLSRPIRWGIARHGRASRDLGKLQLKNPPHARCGAFTFRKPRLPKPAATPELYGSSSFSIYTFVTMETSTGTGSVIDDRRVAVSDRRIAPRMRALIGGQIVWPNSVPVKCIVRNLSQTGARLEVRDPVPNIFDLVFDRDQLRRSCCVVWRKANLIGVTFQ